MLVGVFRVLPVPVSVPLSLPHACGGVSKRAGVDSSLAASSPCLWGCFRFIIGPAAGTTVFPMLVGVFPTQSCSIAESFCLPHACGGVSST